MRDAVWLAVVALALALLVVSTEVCARAGSCVRRVGVGAWERSGGGSHQAHSVPLVTYTYIWYKAYIGLHHTTYTYM